MSGSLSFLRAWWLGSFRGDLSVTLPSELVNTTSSDSLA